MKRPRIGYTNYMFGLTNGLIAAMVTILSNVIFGICVLFGLMYLFQQLNKNKFGYRWGDTDE